MTDAEIIKALECCADSQHCCFCPLKDDTTACHKLEGYALDLINRLQIEIESLKDCPKCIYESDEEVTEYCSQSPCPNFKANKKMNVLIACEESQAVCKAFREKGHEAYSCDIIPCSGGHPEWHIIQDVLPLLNGNCEFACEDGQVHKISGKWDMIIAFPPCTHLAVSGARHFEKKRADGRQREAIEFFCQFLNADCEKIAVENPIGIISGDYIPKWFPDLAEKYGLPIKQSQIIQPYEYGHPSKKSTCLWLKGLPLLKPTNIVEPDLVSYICKDGKKVTFSRHMVQGFENGERAKSRSKTFEGVAKAMADQWG